MFSGIIEKMAKVIDILESGTNKELKLSNPFGKDIYIDQSIAHNGTCLTVTSFTEEWYKVVAIKETLSKTNLGLLKIGDYVNLERSVRADTRMDGHIVQGHVDCTGQLDSIKTLEGSWEYFISIPEVFENLVIPRGSITLNGISLTIANITDNIIQVAIIPYTYEHTNLSLLKIGDSINIEFDVLGKYVVNYMQKIKP